MVDITELERVVSTAGIVDSQPFPVLKTPDVDIVGVWLDSPADVSDRLYEVLSCDEQERANRFRFAEHRQHFIIARASLRQLLAERLRIALGAVELVENSFGKPGLAPVYGSTGLEFNLSHSE